MRLGSPPVKQDALRLLSESQLYLAFRCCHFQIYTPRMLSDLTALCQQLSRQFQRVVQVGAELMLAQLGNEA